MALRYFEDFQVGEIVPLGECTISETEIMEFGRAYDPQFFHVDPERAKTSMYGGLIASGWHTASIGMRLLVDGLLSKSASMGSPGLDALNWHKPVRPEDRLSARFTVLELTPSQTRQDRGRMRAKVEMLNAADDLVLSWTGTIIFGRRPAQ